jgi:hypothetical protein
MSVYVYTSLNKVFIISVKKVKNNVKSQGY